MYAMLEKRWSQAVYIDERLLAMISTIRAILSEQVIIIIMNFIPNGERVTQKAKPVGVFP